MLSHLGTWTEHIFMLQVFKSPSGNYFPHRSKTHPWWQIWWSILLERGTCCFNHHPTFHEPLKFSCVFFLYGCLKFHPTKRHHYSFFPPLFTRSFPATNFLLKAAHCNMLKRFKCQVAYDSSILWPSTLDTWQKNMSAFRHVQHHQTMSSILTCNKNLICEVWIVQKGMIFFSKNLGNWLQVFTRNMRVSVNPNMCGGLGSGFEHFILNISMSRDDVSQGKKK